MRYRTVLALTGIVLTAVAACTSSPTMQPPVRPAPNRTHTPRAEKCASPAFVWPAGGRKVVLDPAVVQTLTVHVGDRLLIGGPPSSCGTRFGFDGRPVSPVLVTHDTSEPAARWYRAALPGTVTVRATRPMCPQPDPDHVCRGGLVDLGSVRVHVEPALVPPPVARGCTAHDLDVRTESSAAGSFRPSWATVRLVGRSACHLSGPASIRVRNGAGHVVAMPRNPDHHRLDVDLRPGHPVVVQWFWQYPFCGRGRHHTVLVQVLGVSGGAARATPPGCPTDSGGPPVPPGGLRFDRVTVLR